MKPLTATAALASVLAATDEAETARAHAYQQGMPALIRLLDVARRHSGQSAVVGRFLLGLYNGPDAQLWTYAYIN